jgi:carbon storage regulator
MLILSRKLGESIVIDGRITVKIVRLEGEIVKLGIDAPLDIPVHRQEVYEEIQRSNREALAGESANVPTLAAKNGAAPILPPAQPGKVIAPKTRG